MPAVAVGVLQVPCRLCRAAVGRPCRDRRGYLHKAHGPRVLDWHALEVGDMAVKDIPANVIPGRDEAPAV